MDTDRYIIDTNILIYAFGGSIPESEIKKLSAIIKSSFNISVISRIEFLGWKRHTEEGFKKAEEFLNHAFIIGIDKSIADKAIEIRRKHSIKLPDALIAAAALNYNLTLVTRNEKDFKNLAIKIYNPF